MKELHDLTGSFAVTIIVALVVLGMAAFQFAAIKDIVKVRRPLLIQLHFYLTPVLLAVLMVHLFTTDKRPLLLLGGLILVAFTAIAGLALRIKKLRANNFKNLVYLKIFLLCVAMLMTAVGHNALDEHKTETSHIQGDAD